MNFKSEKYLKTYILRSKLKKKLKNENKLEKNISLTYQFISCKKYINNL